MEYPKERVGKQECREKTIRWYWQYFVFASVLYLACIFSREDEAIWPIYQVSLPKKILLEKFKQHMHCQITGETVSGFYI
jgi:hypothetical protein